MFLEKFSRFFRRYELSFHPRHAKASYLPLTADANAFSVRDALQKRIDEEKAVEALPNGDVVELIRAEYLPAENALVLLFHRASPNAAEPAYRKKAREKKKILIRQAVKEDGEEQTVSAHFVIKDEEKAKGVYNAALEEIPGISLSAIKAIISQALNAYEYDFKRKNKNLKTYSVFKAEGIKSETVSNALKTGEAKFLTLVRPAKPKFADAEGIFIPVNEVMRIRITGKLTSENWSDKLTRFVGLAKEEGWQDFNIDLGLDDNRNRTVRLDRDQEAKEILFVRSEQVAFKIELQNCSGDVIAQIVSGALSII